MLAIDGYTGINKSLRSYFNNNSSAIAGSDCKLSIAQVTNHIDGLFKKYKSDVPIILYRWTNFPKLVDLKIKFAFQANTKVVVDKGFMSSRATITRNDETMFGEELNIFITNDYLNIDILNNESSEFERLINRGLKWNVLEYSKISQLCKS